MIKTIITALLIATLVAFMIWAFVTGPDLLEIIDNPKF